MLTNFFDKTYKAIKSPKVLVTLTVAVAALSTISATIPSEAHAVAQKTVSGSAPFSPGETVTVQIAVPKPTSVTISPFEVVFVVDASGSMATDIATAKSRMVTFANWIADPNSDGNTADNLFGYVKVGVMSYGYEGGGASNNPYIRTYYNLTTINSTTDRNNLINGINAITANPPGWGFSDIRAGMQAANNMLTTGAASGKYIILVTDGINNMPASSSYYLGPWSGQCVLNSNRTANISGVRYTHFLAVAVGSDLYNQVPSATSYSVPGLVQYVPPCQSYIWANGSRTGSSLINDMVAYYPGSNTRSSTIDEPILAIKQAITPVSIGLQDIINTSIFSSIPSAGSVVNCANNTGLTASNTVSGRRINSTITYNSSISSYCLRFTATLSSSVGSGTYTINNNDSTNNWIRFYNANGQVIARDTIALGSITVTGNPDMTVSEHWLTNSSGTVKSVFNINENIYVHASLQNVGDATMAAGTATSFYKHASASVGTNTASNVPMYIIGHGALGAGGVRTYDSRSGGYFPSTSSPSSVVGNPRSWTYSTPGNYNSVAFTNYTNNVTESSYPANNRRSSAYSVITPPSGLQTNNLLCYRTDLRWTAGSSNITGYDVRVTDIAAAVQSVLNGTPYNDYVTYNHSVAATPTTMTATNLKANTLYAWSLTPRTVNGAGSPVSISFTTPACPDFSVDLSGPYAVNPGQAGDLIVDVGIDYLPDPNGNQKWIDHGSRLTVGVVGINFNNTSCAAYSATGAPFTGDRDGLTARVSGSPSLAARTLTTPTNPVPFTVRTTAATNTGRYTVCFGVYSPDSYIPRRVLEPVHVNVELRPWIQVDRPTGFTTSLVGDVHSNAAINISVPINQYFFKNGTAGVVSAYGSSGNNISIATDRTTNVAGKLWRIPSYSERIKTEAFANLVSLAESGLDDPAAGLAGGSAGLPEQANMIAQCATGGGSFMQIPSTGTYTRTTELDLGSPACRGKNLIYFIDGNLVHNANIIDDTTDATITFIVRGNVVVAPSVTRLDGVHIFGGSFRDGSVYNTTTGAVDQPLVINGSLIGLATQSPATTSGTFSQGTYSGLQRNLSFGASGNDSVPAERIVYQPKYLYLLRNMLGSSNFTWSE